MALSTIVIVPEWDPDGDGSYTNMDTTDDVFSLGPRAGINVSRNVDYQDGMLVPVSSDVNLMLRNKNGLLTPRYASSALYGRQLHNIPIRVKATHNAVTYNLWAGFVRKRNRQWVQGTLPTVSLNARDLLGILADELVTVVNTSAIDIDNSMKLVLDTCKNVVSGDYSLTDSAQVVDVFFAEARKAGEVLDQLALCEMGGALYPAGDGKVTFKPRSTYLGYTLADSAADTWGASTGIVPEAVTEQDSDDELVTSVTVNPKVYNVTGSAADTLIYSEGVAFASGKALHLAANEQIGPRVLHPNQAGMVAISSGASPVCVANVDYKANSQEDGLGTDYTANILVTLFQVDNQWYYTIQETAGNSTYIGQFFIRGIAIIDGAQASSAGYTADTAPVGSDDAGVGSVAWVNPTNILSTNAAYASAVLTAGQTSHYLKALFPAINVPNGAIITGMKFDVEARRQAGTGGTQQLNVRATKWDVVSGARLASPSSINLPLTTSITTLSFGGPSELFGMKIDPTETGSNFGCLISVNTALADTYDIDHVSCTVYYIQTYTIANGPNREITRKLALPGGIKGGREVSVTLPWVSDESLARDYCEQLLRIGRYGSGIVKMSFKVRNNETAKAMFTADIGRLVKYTMPTAYTTNGNTQDGDNYSAEYFRILGLDWHLNHRKLHTVDVTLLPAYNCRNLDKIAWDDFRRPNASSLGKTFTGDTWTDITRGFDIDANKAIPESALECVSYFDLAAADMACEASVDSLNASSSTGIIFRFTDINNFWRVYVDRPNSQIRIQSILGGAANITVIKSASPTAAELRVICQGSRIRVWLDGILVYDTTSSTLATATKVGLWSLGATAPQYSNFYAQGL